MLFSDAAMMPLRELPRRLAGAGRSPPNLASPRKGAVGSESGKYLVKENGEFAALAQLQRSRTAEALPTQFPASRPSVKKIALFRRGE
ncbi:hypothetical protein [Ensifer sp. LCM 4579]|uniref:hypothetical protein n=1 Tax=Ensifer sp. LCM 4579 TaxID=1848292 RepID=UPI00155E65B0|nr:hypothetical protein [Ensifer sp. LCM 4579]